MTNRAIVTDTSFWQEDVDHSKMVAEDVFATIIRAGSANKFSLQPYTDFRFHEVSASAIRHLPSTCYYYVRLGGNIREQINYFIDLWKLYPFNFEPVLDIEDPFYPDGRIIDPPVMRDNLLFAINLIKERTGHYPILYSRSGFFNVHLGYETWMGLCKFWVARYPYTTHRDNVLELCQEMQPGILPQPWEHASNTDLDDEWEFWQCSGDENRLGYKYGVTSSAIDLSLSRFSRQDHTSRMIRPFIPFNPPPGGPMIPAPVVFYRVVADGSNSFINIRTNHGRTFTDLGNVLPGTVVPAFAEFKKMQGFNGKMEHWILTKLSDDLSGWVAVEHNGKVLCELVS